MHTKVRIQKSEIRSKKGVVKIMFSIFFFILSVASNAQCAMCRAALGGDANNAQAEAVNDGIVYLMAIPYLLVAGIGYAVYKMKKNKK